MSELKTALSFNFHWKVYILRTLLTPSEVWSLAFDSNGANENCVSLPTPKSMGSLNLEAFIIKEHLRMEVYNDIFPVEL